MLLLIQASQRVHLGGYSGFRSHLSIESKAKPLGRVLLASDTLVCISVVFDRGLTSAEWVAAASSSCASTCDCSTARSLRFGASREGKTLGPLHISGTGSVLSILLLGDCGPALMVIRHYPRVWVGCYTAAAALGCSESAVNSFALEQRWTLASLCCRLPSQVSRVTGVPHASSMAA